MDETKSYNAYIQEVRRQLIAQHNWVARSKWIAVQCTYTVLEKITRLEFVLQICGVLCGFNVGWRTSKSLLGKIKL